jgi:hypothetical protein
MEPFAKMIPNTRVAATKIEYVAHRNTWNAVFSARTAPVSGVVKEWPPMECDIRKRDEGVY